MKRAALAGWTETRLRLWLALFFVALAVPTAVLVRHAYSQLKWEAFHQHQVLAEELGARIDGRFIELINREEARSFADYGFLVVAGDPSASFLQRSPLSSYPVSSEIPGLIGYFQVDAEGSLTTPLLPLAGNDPAQYGISNEELQQRTALADRLRHILGENRLVQVSAREPATPVLADAHRRDKDGETRVAESATSLTVKTSREGIAMDADAPMEEEQAMPQAAFDRLNEAAAGSEQKKKQEAAGAFGRVEDLKLDYRYQQQAAPTPAAKSLAAPQRQILADNLARLEKRGTRKEVGALPELEAPAASMVARDERREAHATLGASFASVAELEAIPGIGPPSTVEATLQTGSEAESAPRIRIFESEIDTFDFALLDSGHFVLFRKVWRDGQRYIQGALLEQQPLLGGLVESALRETALAQKSDLVVAWQDRVLSVFSGQASRTSLSGVEGPSGALLYQMRLSAPLGDMTLLFSINRLPAGPGGAVTNWLAAILALVLCSGFYFMYRLGLRQIELARQQQDFVSAVSHELKTPLTSIRMYGEMLREGWVPEEKQRVYFDYIYDESERLSRLISNILQLARMTRNDLRLDLQPVKAGRLVDAMRSKVASQTEHAGFALSIECAGEAGDTPINVDRDAFSQILINLVDNAIKFSAKAERKAVDIACRREGDGLVFSVRDYGPGVPRDQMKKIFGLFYRAGNELTRETLGTGIGLALVNQLARSMRGRVDVINREPGAEFRVTFPV